MVEPKTKDGVVFKVGMPLITDAGVRFQTAAADYELEFAGGHWALFRTGQDQGLKVSSFYSSPAARFADNLREARTRREFSAVEEARFEEFVNACLQPFIAEPN